MDIVFRVVAHTDLTTTDLEGLRQLFDAEYLEEFGPWTPGLPYGYAAHETHIIATEDERIVSHVGFESRQIDVGTSSLLVAGTGGVLTPPTHRGAGLARATMRHAQQAMNAAGADFGYLGCAEEVVGFYEASGWTRISAPERHLTRDRGNVEHPAGQPILICPGRRHIGQWPAGTIDLHGLPW
jgi:aminoglycoside 2'-N-acetyltransferase I